MLHATPLFASQSNKVVLLLITAMAAGCFGIIPVAYQRARKRTDNQTALLVRMSNNLFPEDGTSLSAKIAEAASAILELRKSLDDSHSWAQNQIETMTRSIIAIERNIRKD
jgi:hypothetical protein